MEATILGLGYDKGVICFFLQLDRFDALASEFGIYKVETAAGSD